MNPGLHTGPPTAQTQAVAVGLRQLPGSLVQEASAKGLVLFAHGSGSSRLSPRNQRVAQSLQRRGLATLLFDLLQADEAASRAHVFDIEPLAGRRGEALAWVRQ